MVGFALPFFIFQQPKVTGYYASLYVMMGLLTAYSGIWFSDLGYSDAQISVINVAPIVFMLLINVFVGRLADRASDWRTAIVLGSVLSAVFATGILFSTSYLVILISLTLSSVVVGVTIPVTDAATMRLSRRLGHNYGLYRSWGTIGYVVGLLFAGWYVSRYGDALFAWFVFMTAFVRALAAMRLPRFRAPEDHDAIKGLSSLKSVMRPWFILPLVGFAMFSGSHLVLSAFQSLFLSRQGYDPNIIGISIAAGAIAETVMFIGYGRISHLMSARGFLAIAGAATVVRWIGFGLEPHMGWIIPLQMMHAITFALGFIATISFISNRIADENAAEAQGFLVMIQQVMSIVAMFGAGLLVDILGPKIFFAAAVFAGVGLCFVLASLFWVVPIEKEDSE